MANKAFGAKELNLIGDQGASPVIESPGNLSLNAPTVAISTNATVGGILTATSFVGDGSGLTNVSVGASGININDEGSALGIAGTIDFVGAGISAVVNGGIATVTVTATGSGGGVNTTGTSTFNDVDINGTLESGDIYCVGGNIGVGLPVNPAYSLDIAGDVRLYGGDLWMPYGSDGSMVLSNLGYTRNIRSNSGIPLCFQAFSMDGGIGIGTTNGHGGLYVHTPTFFTGVVTATQFVGDGSGLTGVTATGTGVVVQDEGSPLGTAATINFIGNQVTASILNGICNVNIGGASYADVAGVATVAQNLTGTPDITVGTIGCDDDVNIVGTTPTLKLQDTDAASNYAYAEFDTSQDHTLFLRLRAYLNTPNFRIQSEAGGTPNTDDLFTILGTGDGTRSGFVGINSSDPNERLTVRGNVNTVGYVTATTFYGDGSNLTGVTAVGSGVVIQDEGSVVGTAVTINFVGTAVTTTFASGIATVSIVGGGGKFVDNVSGIHTLSSVGVKTDNPKTSLQVETYGVEAGIGTFIAVVGTPVIVDQFNVSTTPFRTAEYTLHIDHANGMQSQKVLVMQGGGAAYSNEFAIMHSSADPLVSFASTVSGGACQLQMTPLTGTTGITTYRFSRGTLL